jgi:hypothetical protein
MRGSWKKLLTLSVGAAVFFVMLDPWGLYLVPLFGTHVRSFLYSALVHLYEL